ncbi:MAG: hypothetical protein ACJ74O_17805 [Frankiaceae bacterium]
MTPLLAICSRARHRSIAVQAALRRQHGWDLERPAAITDVRTSGRWQAIPALRRLAQATPPPASLVTALDWLGRIAPCWSGETVADLLQRGLLQCPMHPAGVLSLADLYGLPVPVELVVHDGRAALWPLATRRARCQALAELVRSANGLGLSPLDLAALADRHGVLAREVTFAAAVDERLGVADGRVDDESSGLARHVGRTLVVASDGLTLDSLSGGVGIAWRFDGRPVPTTTQLQLWADAQDWLERHDDRVRLAGSLSERRCLLTASKSDEVLAAALRSVGGQPLQHAVLVSALVDCGYSRTTAIYAIATAPILKRTRYGFYVLRT